MWLDWVLSAARQAAWRCTLQSEEGAELESLGSTQVDALQAQGQAFPGCSMVEAENEEGVMQRDAAAAAKSLQACPTLCDPIDGSPPGSAVPGILQARTLEWVAISFSNA